ncbi:MAG: hypothetical protein K8T25_12055 [Planctomycetia bacterium]|nr:hypothetical protein [Planctomycetia bacterium]
MNANEVLRIVDAIHRDKNIGKEVVFQAIEQALISTAKKYYGEEQDIEEQDIIVQIDRQTGAITGSHNSTPLDLEEAVSRIGAQTTQQLIIQKVREGIDTSNASTE